MVSEWRSVIAVSLNVGGGVRLINPAKLYICTQSTGRHMAPDGSVPPNNSENVLTRIGSKLQCHSVSCSSSVNTTGEPIKSLSRFLLCIQVPLKFEY